MVELFRFNREVLMDTFCQFAQMKDLPGHGPFYFRFDIHPVSPGHLLIIPRRHVLDSCELDMEEMVALTPACNAAREYIQESNLKAVYGAMVAEEATPNSVILASRALEELRANLPRDGQNIGWNDGTAAGRTVEHFHIHFIPRYRGDTPHPEGGVRHVIPQHGNYKGKLI